MSGEVVAEVRGLTVRLPDGSPVVDNVNLALHAGEVVSLLGPSGSGKTTFLQAVLNPEELRERGYGVSWDQRTFQHAAAFVPQRGALLDHLDIAGNIGLAQAAGGLARNPLPWLKAVDLDENLAADGRSVTALSGGQAQRVAVARVLAAGRRLIVLDEPSVGLDLVGVRLLARLLVERAREHQAAIIVITHDLAFAGGASDRILFLNPAERRIDLLLPAWAGPVECLDDSQRQSRLAELETRTEQALSTERAGPPGPKKRGARLASPFSLESLRVAGECALRLFDPALFSESLVVLRRAGVQSLLRPLPFYAIVGGLLGLTVPYVVVHISAALKPAAVLGLIGGTYIQSLAPPLSAIIFAATSGSAINAWLGGMRLNGQVLALQGLGVSPARYLWSPAWWALAIGYVVTFLVFVSSMVGGGWLLFEYYGVPDAMAKLTADFLDPHPARVSYLVRCLWLVASYAAAISTIVVAKGREPKQRAEDVTLGMTSSVMRCTLFVVVMELLTVAVLFATSRGPR